MFAINGTLNSFEKKWKELDDWHKSGEGKELLYTVPQIDKTEVSESSDTWKLLSLIVGAYRCGQFDEVASVLLNAANLADTDNSMEMEEKNVCFELFILIRMIHHTKRVTKLARTRK